MVHHGDLGGVCLSDLGGRGCDVRFTRRSVAKLFGFRLQGFEVWRHSTASSASASAVGGISRPMDFAVFRLITNS